MTAENVPSSVGGRLTDERGSTTTPVPVPAGEGPERREVPMQQLERIIATGNAVPRGDSNWIHCPDGFKLSVVAGPGAYCSPKVAIGSKTPWDDVADGYPGPYTAVEIGYPSQRPEPWNCTAWADGWDDHDDHPVCDGWAKYGDETDGIYAYVPVEMVCALIASHCSVAASLPGVSDTGETSP